MARRDHDRLNHRRRATGKARTLHCASNQSDALARFLLPNSSRQRLKVAYRAALTSSASVIRSRSRPSFGFCASRSLKAPFATASWRLVPICLGHCGQTSPHKINVTPQGIQTACINSREFEMVRALIYHVQFRIQGAGVNFRSFNLHLALD